MSDHSEEDGEYFNYSKLSDFLNKEVFLLLNGYVNSVDLLL